MPMHPEVGSHEFILSSLEGLIKHIQEGNEDVRRSIAETSGKSDAIGVEEERLKLLANVTDLRNKAVSEDPIPYYHFASRVSVVGIYQSVLSKLFSDIPQLQGYGDGNAIWAITPIEESIHAVETTSFSEFRRNFKSFFKRFGGELTANPVSVFKSFLDAWKAIPQNLAAYPPGVPSIIPFADDCRVALLADWGGDNPAAKHVAKTASESKGGFKIEVQRV